MDAYTNTNYIILNDLIWAFDLFVGIQFITYFRQPPPKKCKKDTQLLHVYEAMTLDVDIKLWGTV